MILTEILYKRVNDLRLSLVIDRKSQDCYIKLTLDDEKHMLLYHIGKSSECGSLGIASIFKSPQIVKDIIKKLEQYLTEIILRFPIE